MFRVGQRAQSSLDLIPALFIVDRCAHDAGDVLGSFPLASTSIDLGYEIIIEDYMNSHGVKLSHVKAHWSTHSGYSLSDKRVHLITRNHLDRFGSLQTCHSLDLRCVDAVNMRKAH
jgi:hypothetical protein